MTDRHAGYVVVLDQNVRDDDAEEIMTALRMVRGVIDVKPIINNMNMTSEQMVVRSRVKHELTEEFFGFLQRLDNPEAG